MAKLSYSKRLIVINAIKIAVVLMILVSVGYFSLSWSIGRMIDQKSYLDPEVIKDLVLLTIGALLFFIEIKILKKFGTFFDRAIYVIKNALKGNRGEKKSFDVLAGMLGDSYRLHKNLEIPGKKFDIDAIVVGPKGVIAFEIKNLGITGDLFRFEGKNVYKVNRYRNGNICSCQLNNSANPFNEVSRHNTALEEWLMKNDFGKIRAKTAILMVGNSMIEIEKPDVYVIKGVEGIKEFIDKSFEDPRFTPEYCDKLNGFLDKFSNA